MKTRHRTLFIIGALIVVLFVGLTPVIERLMPDQSRSGRCLHHARTIAQACRLYANDGYGAFPQRLEDLIPNYLPDGQMFVCPLKPEAGVMGYDYYGGKVTDPPRKVLLRSKMTDGRHRRIVVYCDMSGQFVPEPLP